MLIYHNIVVDEDDMREAGWKGTLREFAADAVNKWKDMMLPLAKIITVESTSWVDEVRPLQCNSSTWYKRRSVNLNVWLESELPVPQKAVLKDEGRGWIIARQGGDSEYLKREFLWKRSNPDKDGDVMVSLEPCSNMLYIPGLYIGEFTEND